MGEIGSELTVGARAIKGIQLSQCRLQTLEVFFASEMNNVQVKRRDRRSLEHSANAAYDDELNAMFDENTEDPLEVRCLFVHVSIRALSG